jgi:hypothetical protein
MLAVKPTMVVASPINPDVTLLTMFARVVNLMLIAHLQLPIAMPMELAKIADFKVLVSVLVVLVEPSLMVPLELLPLTATVIHSLVSVWISVFKILIAWMPANPGVKLNVVVV